MKTTKFTRESLGEIREELKKAIGEVSAKYGIEICMGGAHFSGDSFKTQLTGYVTTDGGERVTPEHIHLLADTKATSYGVTFNGHVIGSTYLAPDGYNYTVTDYVVARKRYPFELYRVEDKKRVKAGVEHLLGFRLTVRPDEFFTLKEFSVWCTTDPESDRVSRKDERTYDRVNDILSNMASAVIVDEFMNEITRLEEDLKLVLNATEIYERLSKNGMSNTLEFLKAIK